MASEIAIIKVPAPIVTLQQFAELEGVSERTAYRWTTGDNPCVQSNRAQSVRVVKKPVAPSVLLRALERRANA